jgi:hypothetical protein
MGQRDEVPPLVEPIPIPTIFLAGVVIEEIGDCFIITGFSVQRSPVDGQLERKIESRIAMTRNDLVKSMVATARATGFALAGELATDRNGKSQSKH